jgi:hypothetical protein
VLDNGKSSKAVELSEELSPYAWMSVRDGELIRAVLLNMTEFRHGQPLRVLEWGAGLSTLSYSAILARMGVPFHWLALEYDREFCEKSIAPELLARSATSLRYVDENRVLEGLPSEEPNTEVLCWNRSALRPFLGPEHAADRKADLDEYVNYPLAAGLEVDVVLVDGRKRRRCLLAALDVIASKAVVLLHDAFREHYHCAMREYPASRLIGDELWIGAREPTSLNTALAGQDGAQ